MSRVILELARAIPKESLHLGRTLSPSTWGCVQYGASTAGDAKRGSCLRKEKRSDHWTPR